MRRGSNVWNTLARLGGGVNLGLYAVIAALSSSGSGGAAVTYAVADQGGQSAGDRYGSWPTLTVGADDIVLDPYTGEYAAVDAGYEVGDEVGEGQAYVGGVGKGDGTFAIYGEPASQRRQGFDQMDFTNNVGVTLAGDAHTFIGRAALGPGSSTGENPFFGIDASDHRWGIQFVSANELNARLFDNSTVRATATITSGSAFAAGETVVVAGTQDSEATATTQLIAWQDDGNEIDRASATWGGGVTSLAGEYRIGRGRGGGDFVNGTVQVLGGVDGSALTFAQMEALELLVNASQDADELTLLAPIAWVDGEIRGLYSRAADEILPELSGAGDLPLVVVPEEAGPTYTQPSEVAGLVADFDAYRGATYSGTTLTGCRDFGPNRWDLTHASTVGQRTVDMIGRSVFLPGTGGGTYLERAITTTVEDFTLICSIPISSYSSTGRKYFSWNVAAIATWGLEIGQASSTTMSVLDHTGAVVGSPIVHGSRTSGNGAQAHAVLVVRRTVGGNVLIDAWYDQDTGAGVVRSTQVVAADSFAAAIAVTGVSLGGRYGSSPGSWNAFSGVHRVTWHDSALDDDDVVALVKAAMARTGNDPDSVTI